MASLSHEMRHVIGEGQLKKLGLEIHKFKDPDLFIVDEHGQAIQIIEHAGNYDEQHLRDFHAHCAGGGHQKLVPFGLLLVQAEDGK